jgi:hypothetical protein
MSETLDTLVKTAHAGKAVYHVSRDSMAIEAREKPQKKEKRQKAAREAQKGGDSPSEAGNRY